MSNIVKSVSIALRVITKVSPRLAGRAAFYLFCHPVARAKVRESDRDVHDRAERSTVTVDGNTVSVYRWGGGERPVLLAHGWSGRASHFTALVEAFLERGVPVIAFDAPGHGDSPGTTTHILHYEAIIQRLYKDNGAFRGAIAHSFGSLGVFKALRSGVEAGRVVTIAGVCDFSYLLDVFADQLGLSDAVKSDLRVRSELLLASGTDIWDRFSVSHDSDLIQVPILVVQDGDDATVALSQAHRIVAAFEPRARLMTTESLGHRRVLRSRNVVSAVVDFVEGKDEQ